MPPVKAPSREEATKAFVDVAFDDAFSIREHYAEVLERRKANREQLRSLAAQGHLDDEQRELMDELYPPRARAEQESEEAAQEPQDGSGGGS